MSEVIKKGLDLKFNDIINEKIKKIEIKRLKYCSEVIIKIDFNKSLGLKPVDYRIDLNGNYDDKLGFIRNQQGKLYQLFNVTNERSCILKVWDLLEQDNVIPCIGAIIDNQADVWDNLK